MNNSLSKTYKLVLSAVLGSICIVLGFTPLGFIPIGPLKATILHIPVIIGAIYGGPVVGIFVGCAFGIMSVIQAPTSTIFAPIWANAGIKEFIFIGITAIIPRIFIGISSYYTYKFSKKIAKRVSYLILAFIGVLMLFFIIFKLINSINNNEPFFMYGIMLVALVVIGILSIFSLKNKETEIVLTAGIGTLTNTVFFLLLTYIFFGDFYAELMNVSKQAVRNILVTAGITNGIPEIIVSVILISAIASAIKPKEN